MKFYNPISFQNLMNLDKDAFARFEIFYFLSDYIQTK